MDFPRSDLDNSLILSLEFLKGVPNDERLHALFEGWGVRSYRDREVIFAQKDEAKYTYVVLSGQVTWARRKDPTALGEPILSHFVKQGGLLGQHGLLYDSPHVYTAKADGPCELLLLDNQALNRLLYRYTHVQGQMVKLDVIGRLRAVPWLAELNLIDISLLADVAVSKSYLPDAIVYHKEQVGEASFYIIDRGQVDLSYGRQGIVRFLGNGTVFGIFPMLEFGGYRNTATVRCASEIFVFPHNILRGAARYYPKMSKGDRHDVRVEALHKTHLFAGLGDQEISKLAGYASHIHMPNHHLISLQKESAHALWLLMPGSTATLHVLNDKGEALPEKRVSGPIHFGEAALLMEAPITSTIEASPGSQWLKLDRQDFLAFDRQEGGKIIPKLNPSPATLKIRREEGERKQVSWLAEDEALLLYDRRHWFILVRKLIPGLILAGILLLLLLADWGLALESPGLLVVLTWGSGILALLAGLWGWLAYWNDFLFVTSKRVVQQDKVIFFNETRREASLHQIQNITVRSGLFGNIFGYGDVVIQTASKQGNIVFDYAPSPAIMRDTLFGQMQLQRNNLQAQTKMNIQERLEARLGIKLIMPDRVLVSVSKGGVDRPAGFWKRWWARLRTLFSPIPSQWEGTAKVVWREHWLILASKLLTPIVLLLLSVVVGLGGFLGVVQEIAGAVVAVELLASVVGLISLATGWWIFADWHNDTYELTNTMIVDISKLPLFFAEERRQAQISEIQDIQFEKPTPIHYIFNFGDVKISTAATEGIFTFDRVPDPASVVDEIRRRVEKWRFADETSRANKRAEELPDWFEVYKRLDSREAETGRQEGG